MRKHVVDSYLVADAGFKLYPPFLTPRVIEPLKDDYYIKIRKSFLLMCEKNSTAAAILDMLITYVEGRAGSNCKNNIFHTDAMHWITFSKRSLIAKFDGMASEHTIMNAIKLLANKGLLIVKRGVSTGNSQYQQSNKYKVNTEEVRKAHSIAMGIIRAKGHADRFGVTLTDDESATLQDLNTEVSYIDIDPTEDEYPQDGWSEIAPVPSNEGGAELLQGGANLLHGGAELLHDNKNYTEVLKEEDSTDSFESCVKTYSRLDSSGITIYSGNENSLLNEREKNSSTTDIDVLFKESVTVVDVYCPSFIHKNINPKTNSRELESSTPKTEEKKKTSSRLEEAPTELFFNMDDIRAVISTYHREVPMKGRPKGDGSVNALLSKYGQKVGSLLSEYTVEELEEGISRFMDDDFWKKKGYPLNGFISQADRFAGNEPRIDFKRSPLVGYQKVESIEPDPVSSSNPPTPAEKQQRLFRLRVQELRKMLVRCKLNDSDFDLDSPEAVELSFGRVATVFEELHGYQYPVTTSPCKT